VGSEGGRMGYAEGLIGERDIRNRLKRGIACCY
jgi:hypothetical protein